MTNTEKRSLYENIMKDVAKVVKRHLNENNTPRCWRNRLNESAIGDLTRADFKDPANNELFQSMAPETISATGNSISLTVTATNLDDSYNGTFTITRRTMYDVMFDLNTVILAALSAKGYDFINIVADKDANELRKQFVRCMSEDERDDMDDYCEELAKLIESNNDKVIISRFCRQGRGMLR